MEASLSALFSDSFGTVFEKPPTHSKVLLSLEYFPSGYFLYLTHPNLGKTLFFTLFFLKFLASNYKLSRLNPSLNLSYSEHTQKVYLTLNMKDHLTNLHCLNLLLAQCSNSFTL